VGPKNKGTHVGVPLRRNMKYNPDIHHRHSIRLREYDYSANGAYFVTICVQGRGCLFGQIYNGEMILNDAGNMVKEWWRKLPTKFDTITNDTHAIMPNHFHGIITIVGAATCGRPDVRQPHGVGPDGHPHGAEKQGHPRGGAPTLGDVVDWFKTMTTNAYIRGVNERDWSPFPGRLWQRNYYERVIRTNGNWPPRGDTSWKTRSNGRMMMKTPANRRGTPMWVP
jgi:putative transposase